MVTIPHTIWLVFFFAIGASVGSFLNVVVYRMPLDLSIARPGSHCPSCKHPLAWYDNLPIIAWFFLGGKCRYCKTGFSFRYPFVELLTACLFVGLYWAYFMGSIRSGLPPFEEGGWIIYLGHISLIGMLLAASLIDAEHFIIPLPICYFIVVVGLVIAAVAGQIVDVPAEKFWRVGPYALARSGAAGLGATIGLAVSFCLLKAGLIKRSFYEFEQAVRQAEKNEREVDTEKLEEQIQIRREMVREMAFLVPVVLLAWGSMVLLTGEGPLAQQWDGLLAQQKWLAGLLGSIFGFMIGAAVVWATRILGTLLFGKEAMGLGDVHLMAAVGAMLGWQSPTVAFFLAPFFGLGFALVKLITHRTREIPYGPFLSMATLAVMVFHDPIMKKLLHLFRGSFGSP